ncbi:hypothetical protein M3C66_009980 [Micrococcus luteus]|nr:hypothetical protein [Micrococcus luteus]
MSEPNDSNVQVIENATRDDVRPGDHVTWEETRTVDGVTIVVRREGIAHRRYNAGDWCTDGDRIITMGEGEDVTITIRRPVQELPTALCAVIVAKEEGGRIEAMTGAVVWYANEAVLGPDNRWRGVWRTDSGRVATSSVSPEDITPGTWKVDDR